MTCGMYDKPKIRTSKIQTRKMFKNESAGPSFMSQIKRVWSWSQRGNKMTELQPVS